MKINKSQPRDHAYLARLDEIHAAPETIYYRGGLPAEPCPTVAIVGSRRPTSYGREVAHDLASQLAKKGVVIVSGMALGIDSVAHRAALDVDGTTLAVLGNSVDIIYPRNHAQLAKDILTSGGAILSEYKPPTEPRDYQFLARNRLVSGLADAVIIVEAAARSGTLSTAAHALEQGREVLVVPGNITSPLSAGCNQLIRQGAQPVTSASDVLEVIAPQMLGAQASLPLGSTPLEVAIIEHLQSGVRDGDQLQQNLQVDPAQLNQTLTMMEINGLIRPLGGNQWTLA